MLFEKTSSASKQTSEFHTEYYEAFLALFDENSKENKFTINISYDNIDEELMRELAVISKKIKAIEGRE